MVKTIIHKNNLIIKAMGFSMALILTSCDFTPPINRRIIEAQNYIASHDYAKSAVLYEDILNGHPNDDLRLKICYQLGEIYSIYLGEYKKALKNYNEVKTLTEDPIWLIKIEEKLAEINFNYLKDYKTAIENYKRLTEFTPKLSNFDYFELQTAISYFYLNNKMSALEVLNTIQSDPSHQYYIRSFYYLGLIYFEEKEFNKALYVWQEYIKRETNKDNLVQAKFMIANIYESLENLKMAYDIYYSIVNDYPNPEVIQSRLTSLYNRRISRRR